MSAPPTPRNVFLYPLLPLAAAFAIGILIETFCRTNGLVLGVGIGTFSLAGYLFRGDTIGTLFIVAAFLFLGAFCAYTEKSTIAAERIRTLIDTGSIPSEAPAEIEGTLIEPLQPSADGFISIVEVQSIRYRGQVRTASGRVRIYMLVGGEDAAAHYDELDLHYGSHVSIACEISREEQYQNPGVASRIDLLDRQGIDAVATIKSPLVIENLGEDSVFLPIAWAYDLRQSLLDEFRARLSPSTAGVLSASMLGDKYFLDEPTADIFRGGGTFHVLVISGLHITFIGGLLMLLVGGFTRNKLIRFFIVSSTLWTYALAVGGGAPVARACLMFTILLFSTVMNRQGSLLNSFGLCLIILLVWRPSDVFNSSLQLTLLSVLAIIGMAFPLIEKLRSIGSWMPSAATPFPPNVPKWLLRSCEMLYWKPAAWQIESSRQIWSARIFKSPYLASVTARVGQKTIAYLFEGSLVSVIVQAWLLPLLIIYFHRISPISIFMNLWAGIAIALESFAALSGVVVSRFSEFLAGPFFSFTEFLNYLLSSLPASLAHSEWSSWRVPNYSGISALFYVFYFIPLVVLTFRLWKWNVFGLSRSRSEDSISNAKFDSRPFVSMTVAASLLFAAILILHPFSAPRADGHLHIDFLDVGQGDSAFVTFPDGTTMLIDGGGRMQYRKQGDEDQANNFIPDSPGIGEAVVSPVLWNKGYSHIDYILATHADADHIQGLIDVAANFDVGEALFGREAPTDPEFEALKSVLDRRHIPAVLISRGQQMSFGGAAVEVLYPMLDNSPAAPSDNNHSVVLRIVYGNRAFLLTGDIEADAEKALVNGGGILKADVLKVPHHGSRTSSTPDFISAVQPEYAIISVGRHSRFGHPHKEVVERWLAAGSKVMTTGENGMISVATDGRDLSIKTFADASDKKTGASFR